MAGLDFRSIKLQWVIELGEQGRVEFTGTTAEVTNLVNALQNVLKNKRIDVYCNGQLIN